MFSPFQAKDVFIDQSDILEKLLQMMPPGNPNAKLVQELIREPDLEVT